jgi:hypothetical protein
LSSSFCSSPADSEAYRPGIEGKEETTGAQEEEIGKAREAARKSASRLIEDRTENGQMSKFGTILAKENPDEDAQARTLSSAINGAASISLFAQERQRKTRLVSPSILTVKQAHCLREGGNDHSKKRSIARDTPGRIFTYEKESSQQLSTRFLLPLPREVFFKLGLWHEGHNLPTTCRGLAEASFTEGLAVRRKLHLIIE